MLPAPVSVSKAALIIKAQLELWSESRGGTVKIVANLSHLFEEMLVYSDKPRILICCTGEDPRGSDEMRAVWHRVDRQWQVTVVRGHGFRNNIAEAGGDNEPFTDSWEAIRDEVRKILNISEEFPVEYKGAAPLPSIAPTPQANVFMDAVALLFSTANDLPGISTTPSNQNPS